MTCSANQTLLGLSLLAAHAALAQSWTKLTPTGPLPAARAGESAVYAAPTNKLILFGGYDFGASSDFFFNDLWILSGANGVGGAAWAQAISQGAAGSPVQREGTDAVYDPNSNRMVIFGGDTNGPGYNDVWVLTNADGTSGTPIWIQQHPTNPPPGRTGAKGGYDPVTNRLIIFGGQNSGSSSQTLFNDVWVLTNANGTGSSPPVWIELSPAAPLPQPRSHHMAAYDSSLNRMVVYGGEQASDIWVLSNANGLGGSPVWTQLAPSGQPAPQGSDALLAYDSGSERLMIFGGFTISTFQTTNAFDLLSNSMGFGSPVWQPVNPTGTAPSARDLPVGAYDQAGNNLIVFGGSTGGAGFLNDSWVLSNANGIVGSQLSVSQISPNYGGNLGAVTITMNGTGFEQGAQAKLAGLGPDILGSNVQVNDLGLMTATFNLNGATPGARNVVVTNPDNSTFSDSAAFTIQTGGTPQLWAQLFGYQNIRVGVAQTYYIEYGNRGNADALGTRLLVYFPSSVAPSVSMGNANGEVSSLTLGSTLIVMANLGIVPAGSTTLIPVTMTVSASQAPFQVQIKISGH